MDGMEEAPADDNEQENTHHRKTGRWPMKESFHVLDIRIIERVRQNADGKNQAEDQNINRGKHGR